jgi:hypothetical protein
VVAGERGAGNRSTTLINCLPATSRPGLGRVGMLPRHTRVIRDNGERVRVARSALTGPVDPAVLWVSTKGASMAAMKPRTGDGPLEVTKEGRGIVMRVPLEGGGRLVVEMSPDEATALGDALKTAVG